MYSYETSVDFLRTTLGNIRKGKTLYNHRCENLRSYTFLLVCFRQISLTSKSSIFWDLTPCSPLNVNRHFGGICRLHLKGRRMSQERNQRDALYTENRLACWAIVNFSERNMLHGVS
jgi:hypothetical protein